MLVSNNADPMDFGGQSATGVVLARYSPTDQLQWVKSWPDTTDGKYSSHQQLLVSTSGDLVVTGGFSGTVNLGGSDLTSAGDLDIYVASYSAAGNPLWSRRLGRGREDAMNPDFATLKNVLRAHYLAERRKQDHDKMLQEIEERAQVRFEDTALAGLSVDMSDGAGQPQSSGKR